MTDLFKHASAIVETDNIGTENRDIRIGKCAWMKSRMEYRDVRYALLSFTQYLPQREGRP